MTAASGVWWISRRSVISGSLRPLASRKLCFCDIAALRMELSSRNLEAFSIREALGSGGSCSVGSCGRAVLSGCSGEVGSSWRCHEGIPLGSGPSESPIMRIAIVVAVQLFKVELEGVELAKPRFSLPPSRPNSKTKRISWHERRHTHPS